MEDLWPKEIKTETAIKTPVTILKEQASILSKRTGNIIVAKVINTPVEPVFSPGPFLYDFAIVVPTLNNYSYRLFSIYHDVALYPLKIEIDTELKEELGYRDNDKYIEVDDEISFLNSLKKIFNAKKTLGIINSLIAQAKS